MLIYFEIEFFKYIIFSLAIFFFSYFFYYVNIKYSKNIFPISIANQKTSIFHKPIFRGVGILYLFPFIFFYINDLEYFNKIESLLIIFTTLIGYLDDRFDLSQKLKLFLLIVIFLLFSFLNASTNFEILINLTLFLLFVLLFNQIDGINGICGFTFISFVLSIIFFSTVNNIPTELLIVLLSSVMIYLNFNMRLKTVIQGDSGSFFMGVMSYIFVTKTLNGYFSFLSIIFILPLFLDTFITTIFRILTKKSLLEGHRDNIYQKLAIKLKNQNLVTFIFFTIQILVSLIFIITYNFLSFDISLYVTLSIVLIMSLSLIYLRKILLNT